MGKYNSITKTDGAATCLVAAQLLNSSFLQVHFSTHSVEHTLFGYGVREL